MRKSLILTAVCGALFSTASSAEQISNRDDLMSYLEEQLPDGLTISTTISVGDAYTVKNRRGNCFSAGSLGQLVLPIRLAVEHGMVALQLTKEFTGYSPLGGPPGCEYEVVAVGNNRIGDYGIEHVLADGDQPAKIRIPLFQQTLLGVTDADFSGNRNINALSSSVQCDVSFDPWFSNTGQSEFVKIFERHFREDRRYKNVFSEEYKTSTWCMSEHFDGTYKWENWSKL